MREEGFVSILEALQSNKSLHTLICEGQNYQVSRAMLTIIGNLVCYENNSLEVLRVGANRGCL